jgi:hypothetical protein
MSDNSTLDPGAGGDIYRSKDRSGVKTQIVALDLDPGGASEVLGTGDASNGLDVDVTRVSGTVTVGDGGGSLTVDGPVTNTQLRASPVDVATDGLTDAELRATPVDVDPGTVTVQDGGGSISVDDGAGSLTVDGTVTVQDGGGAVSVDDNGGSLTVDNATISVVGGGVEATAQRVTIASDSTGVLSVDDNGGSLTVDGTVTANAGTGPWPVTDNGGSLTVDGSVSVGAALPAGNNNIGDVDVVTAPATAADGAGTLPAVTQVVSGWDGSNVQAISTDSSGVVQVDVLKGPGVSAATRSSVSDTVSDALLLAANTARVGAAIANDSSGVLLVGLGTTAVTSTNYTVRLSQHALYELPQGFQGQVRGLWLTDPNDGAARVTEF